MNKSSAWRKKGWVSQGNNLYLTVHQKHTKKSQKLELNYQRAEMLIDSDNDKLVYIFQSENSGLFIFAIYDTQRVVFIQIEEQKLFGEDDELAWGGT